jgi:hypothetical protein
LLISLFFRGQENGMNNSNPHWLDDEVVGKANPPRRLRSATSRKQHVYVHLTIEGLAAISRTRLSAPAVVLLLEMVRLAGLRWAKRHGGWVVLNEANLLVVGLSDKDVRYRAVKQLVACEFMEVRGTSELGRRLEYRLRPDWAAPAKPAAKVIDLAKVRSRSQER